MGQLITKDTASIVASSLKANRDVIEAACPRGVNVGRVIRIVVNEVAQNSRLAECDPVSIVRGAAAAIYMGLEVNSPLQQAYLVPYRDKRSGISGAQLQIGYRGLLKLAKTGGHVTVAFAHCVYEEDEFTYRLGIDPDLQHVPATGKRGQMIGAYAVVKLGNGERDFEWMPVEEIEKIRKSSRSSDSPAWKVWYDEMAKKCPLRRLLKRQELTPEAHVAASLDDKATVQQQTKEDLEQATIDVDLVVPAEEEPKRQREPQKPTKTAPKEATKKSEKKTEKKDKPKTVKENADKPAEKQQQEEANTAKEETAKDADSSLPEWAAEWMPEDLTAEDLQDWCVAEGYLKKGKPLSAVMVSAQQMISVDAEAAVDGIRDLKEATS